MPPVNLKRVVVTGIGAVSPFGRGVDRLWNSVSNGLSGIIKLPERYEDTDMSYDGIKSRVVGMVPRGEENWQVSTKKEKGIARFTTYAQLAASEALIDAQWSPNSEMEQIRSGVCFGSSIGCMDEAEVSSSLCRKSGLRKISPYFVPTVLINIPAGKIAIEHKLRGPNHSVSTACTTGAHSIGDAMRMIQFGDADLMVAGASESCISPLVMAGFAKARALSTKFNDTPELASRPFSSDRDGFVIAEGAGAIILESLEHAIKRNAKIYCEILGYGLSCDAHHITLPPLDGHGALQSMKSALSNASLKPNDIDYINAHATSTPAGDEIENLAVKKLMDSNQKKTFMISSTKGSTGHLLGASGVVESILTILSIQKNLVPPTLNFNNDNKDFDFDYVPNNSRDVSNINNGNGLLYAMSNSFGFGGTNASLIFGKYKD